MSRNKNVQHTTSPIGTASSAGSQISPAAQRALDEAAQRRSRKKAEAEKDQVAREVGGRKGPDPTRYGDWERKGIASDF